MPYKVRYDDITTLHVDAIVNSLGIDASVYGQLCKNILKAANSMELTSFINGKKKNNIGDMFITSGYNLPATNIIHVVSPFKKDDPDNKQLYKIYSNIVKTAINRGYKTIAIPFLGTGANGYSDKDAFDALTEVCADVMEKEDEMDKDILNIYIVIKGSNALLRSQYEREEYGNFRKERLYSGEFIEDLSCAKSTLSYEEKKKKQGKAINKKFMKCIDVMKNINPDDLLVSTMGEYEYPYDFVEDYVYQNNITDRLLNKNGLDRRIKPKFRTAERLSKMNVFRIAFSLKMNKATTIQFMVLCGHSFSPFEQADMIFIDYLNGKYPGADKLWELSKLTDYNFNW